jgi:hypothetical protein
MGFLGISFRSWLSVFQVDWVSPAMISLLKSGMRRLNQALAHYRQFGASAEDEDLAMNCGTFNPRFLAKIKRSKEAKPITK